MLAGERDWLLARIAEPDLTLRAIVAELAARDVRVSYDAVWRFYRQAGMTFRKKPARSRAGPAGRGSQTGTLASVGRPRPIEQMLSKVKTLLRKADERSVDATWKRIGSLLDRFSPDECGNYLVNSGYAAT